MKNPEEVVSYLRKAMLTEPQINAVLDLGYLTAPASKGHHLACRGGLAEHSIHVAQNLMSMNVCEEVACRVGMLHDLVKCLCYREKDDGTYEYVQPPYPGHGVASVMIAHACGILLSPEDSAAICWHMGVFGMDEKEMKAYREAVAKWPEAVILTHAADHLASAREEKGGAK